MSPWLAGVNAIAAAVTVGFAVVAVVAPKTLARSDVVASTRYYAAMYAARAIPVGGAVIVAAWWSLSNDAWSAVLAVAGACQVGDAVVGLWRRIPGQVAGAVGVGAIHLTSLGYVLITG